MVSTEYKWRMAAFVIKDELCSGRSTCRCLRLARSTFRYRRRPTTAERTGLVTRLHELSCEYSRYGFRRIAVKLGGEGYQVGRKQVPELRDKVHPISPSFNQSRTRSAMKAWPWSLK